jgi:hypothetical protein
MARSTLVAVFAFLMVVTPSNAQTTQSGRILLDMTIQAVPGTPSGHCLYVDAGRLFVEGRLVGENRSTTRINLGPAANVPANVDLQITSPSTTSTSAQV